MLSKVESVNALLLEGEPENISVDEHSGYTGYKPQAIIDAMNEVFWGEWGFEEVSSEIAPGEKGGLAIAQVRVFLQGLEFRPVGWGQNRVTRGDIGDARKGAQTDAIKKALSYFSIGNRAYRGLLKEGQSGKSNGHRPVQAARPVPTSNGHEEHEPTVGIATDDLKAAVDRVKARCQFLQFSPQQWGLMLSDLAIKKVASMADIDAMNDYLTKYEQQLTAAPAN